MTSVPLSIAMLVMLRYAALSELTKLLEEYRIAWTIFEPDEPRVVVMDGLPGWTRLFADDKAVVHVRAALSMPSSDPPSRHAHRSMNERRPPPSAAVQQ